MSADYEDERRAQDADEIDKAIRAELAEIADCLLDIRRKSGWGRVIIEIKGGDIVELDISYKKRPKVEKRKAE